MAAYNGRVNKKQLARLGIVIGPIAAFVVGAATSSVRDQVGASNVGISLAIIVVLAALAGRGAALATAATAALTFNFFHTEPYHSLRIDSSKDVTIVALLAGLGLVVSDISAWIRRRDAISFRHQAATAAPQVLESLLEPARPVAEMWPVAVTSILDQLGLAECRFERNRPTELPLISRAIGRSSDGDDGFVLPSHGASLPVVSGPATLGYLVLTPPKGSSSLWVERRVVIAFADDLAIALTYTERAAASPHHIEEHR